MLRYTPSTRPSASWTRGKKAGRDTPSSWTSPQPIGSGRMALGQDSVSRLATRLRSRSNEVTVRWVAAHHSVLGNETADEYAKAAAEGNCPDDMVPDSYR